jgi:uncharacterized membrane protein YdjX (TVP38/TMEM64 family)
LTKKVLYTYFLGMKRSNLVRWTVVGIVAVTAVFLLVRFDVSVLLRDTLRWIDSLGIVGFGVFAGVYILATVLFIPGSILTLGAGFVFGVATGTAAVSVASTLGAFAAFLVGRYVARDWVARRTRTNPRFAAIDDAVGREGWKIVLLTRLSPVFPFNLLNYAYGLTGVSAGAYFLASWIGMLPGTLMYVYLGSLAANLATLGQAADSRGPLQWVLYGIGLAATVAVTVVITGTARRALKDSIGSVATEES